MQGTGGSTGKIAGQRLTNGHKSATDTSEEHRVPASAAMRDAHCSQVQVAEQGQRKASGSLEGASLNSMTELRQPQPAAKEKPYQARERIKRIHLPVREGMNDLSDDEGDGSEWAIPQLKEGEKLPPGYDGKRRIRKSAAETDGKIKPSYYYPTENNSRGVPVFEPTYEEFRDFNRYGLGLQSSCSKQHLISRLKF